MDPDGRHCDPTSQPAPPKRLSSAGRMLHDQDEDMRSSPRPPKGAGKALTKDDLIAASNAASAAAAANALPAIPLNRAASLPVGFLRRGKAADDSSTGQPPLSPQQKRRQQVGHASLIADPDSGTLGVPPPPMAHFDPPYADEDALRQVQCTADTSAYEDYDEEQGVEVEAVARPSALQQIKQAGNPDGDNLSQPVEPSSLHVPPVFRVLTKPIHDEMSSIGWLHSESSSSGSDSSSSSGRGRKGDFKVTYKKKRRKRRKGDPPQTERPDKGTADATLQDDGDIVKQTPSWKKYTDFTLAVTSSRDNYRAKEVRLFCNSNNNRPHMRALYVGWWCMFVAASCWYGIISILLPELAAGTGSNDDWSFNYDYSNNSGILSSLSRRDVWISIIVSMPLSTMLQAPMGIACEVYGPRKPLLVVMCVLSMPMLASIGMLQSSEGFFLLRFLSGGFGSIFTIVPHWYNQMFVPQVVQSTSCLFGNGNLDSGLSQLLFGAIIYPMLKTYVFDGNMNLVWRTIFIIPCALASITGIAAYFYSDDTPRGNIDEIRRKQQDEANNSSDGAEAILQESKLNFYVCISNFNVWILTLQYSCIFGAFLVFANILPLYFYTQHGQSLESSAAIASIYGFVGLLGRFLGNSWSTSCDKSFGLKGRVLLYTGLLVCEGVMCALFGFYTSTLQGTIAFMALVALFQHAALASIVTIVPYIDPPRTNHVSATVSSGGGIGGMVFGLVFLFWDYTSGFLAVGVTVLVSSILAAFLHVPFRNQDSQGRSRRKSRSGYDHSAMLGDSHRGGGIHNMDIEQGISSGNESSFSETHLSLSTDAYKSDEQSVNAKQIDFTGHVYTPSTRGKRMSRKQKRGKKNSKRGSQESGPSIECGKNHACYELKSVYGAFDDPTVMRSVLGRTPSNFHCRDCKGKLSMKLRNSRTVKSSRRYGIVPSPTRPIFCCVECHSSFICNVCWRHHKQKLQQGGQNTNGDGVPKWAQVASDFLF